MGGTRSAAGIVLAVAGEVREAGTGSQIEARLQQLRQERTVQLCPNFRRTVILSRQTGSGWFRGIFRLAEPRQRQAVLVR